MAILPEECWAEEGGIRVRVSADPDDRDSGRRVIEIIDTTPGWPGKVIASATLAAFRTRRIADALTVLTRDSERDP